MTDHAAANLGDVGQATIHAGLQAAADGVAGVATDLHDSLESVLPDAVDVDLLRMRELPLTWQASTTPAQMATRWAPHRGTLLGAAAADAIAGAGGVETYRALDATATTTLQASIGTAYFTDARSLADAAARALVRRRRQR